MNFSFVAVVGVVSVLAWICDGCCVARGFAPPVDEGTKGSCNRETPFVIPPWLVVLSVSLVSGRRRLSADGPGSVIALGRTGDIGSSRSFAGGCGVGNSGTSSSAKLVLDPNLALCLPGADRPRDGIMLCRLLLNTVPRRFKPLGRCFFSSLKDGSRWLVRSSPLDVGKEGGASVLLLDTFRLIRLSILEVGGGAIGLSSRDGVRARSVREINLVTPS